MENVTLIRKKVYDPFLRFLHAVIGLSVVTLFATAQMAEHLEKGPGESAAWQIHILFGYVLVGALTGRIIWGLVGPHEARLSRLWHPREWWQALRLQKLRQPLRFGHHPLASALYLVFYLALIVVSVSGLALAGAEHGLGPLAIPLFDSIDLKELFKEPHEAVAMFSIAFIVLHIGALVWHERRERVPLAQSMISGYQYLPAETQKEQQPEAKEETT